MSRRSLVIIDNLNVVRIAVAPDEADPVLVVHANAVLPLPITPERLESVSRKDRQIVKRMRGVQLPKLSLPNACDTPEWARWLARENRLRFAVFERTDHPAQGIT